MDAVKSIAPKMTLQTSLPLPTGAYGYPRAQAPVIPYVRSLTGCEKSYLGQYFDGLIDLNKIVFIKSKTVVRNGYNAITFGNFVFANPDQDIPNSPETIALLGHEITHSYQYQTTGYNPLGGSFIQRYIDSYLGGRMKGLGHDKAYHSILFEFDAYAIERRIKTDVKKNGVDCACK
jgi:hypothetical protein